MGGCFPCFGSSDKGGNGVKEVVKKESFKDGSAAVSHHVDRVSSGISSRYLLGIWLLLFLFLFLDKIGSLLKFFMLQ